MKYDEYMDAQCIPLCDKFNELEGVYTYESCCGHNKAPYRIFFHCNNFISLGILSRCVSRNYSSGLWQIIIDNTDTCPSYCFMLESKKIFANNVELNEELNRLIRDIDYWKQEKFNKHFSIKFNYE